MFKAIQQEFEAEFLRTTDMHKKQPTYLVFHRFMYQRMKIKYPGKFNTILKSFLTHYLFIYRSSMLSTVHDGFKSMGFTVQRIEGGK